MSQQFIRGTINSKVAIIIILVVAIIAGGSIWWYAKKGAPQEAPTIVIKSVDEIAGWKIYQNKQYGFSLNLSQGWAGYSVVANTWEGYKNESQGDVVVEKGPKIILRHPKYSETKEEIPVMVFTYGQWLLVSQQKINVSAAPIGPSELGRNAKYIFALPPRYNYGFNAEGAYQDADQIIKTFKSF